MIRFKGEIVAQVDDPLAVARPRQAFKVVVEMLPRQPSTPSRLEVDEDESGPAREHETLAGRRPRQLLGTVVDQPELCAIRANGVEAFVEERDPFSV